MRTLIEVREVVCKCTMTVKLTVSDLPPKMHHEFCSVRILHKGNLRPLGLSKPAARLSST